MDATADALEALQQLGNAVSGGQTTTSLHPSSRPTSAVAEQQPSTAQEVHLTPAKIEFYQALAEQLAEDGFSEESKSVLHKIGSGGVLSLKKSVATSLFSVYAEHVELWRLSAVERAAKLWTPLKPRPLPPIGPQERLLNLEDFVGLPSVEEDLGPQSTRMDLSDPNYRDIADEMADSVRTHPPSFKTRYTAQHKQAVRSVAFSTDGRLCASGSVDTSIKIMDTSKMRMFGVVQSATAGAGQLSDELRPVIRTFYDHVGTVTTLAFHPRFPMLFTGSADKTVKLFDLTKGGINKKAQMSITDVSPINVVCPHPCGDFVIVGTQHPVVRLYDIQTQQCFSSFNQASQHGGSILDVKSASDGSVFVSASSDGNLIFWDGVSNRVVNRIVSPHLGHPVTSIQWSRNNRYVLTGGGDHRARLWDVRTGKELLVYADQPKVTKCDSLLANFVQNEELVMIASFTENEHHSDTAGSDMTFLDARTGSIVIPKASLHPNTVRAMAVSPTDRTVLTGCEDFKVRYIDVIPPGTVESSSMANNAGNEFMADEY